MQDKKKKDRQSSSPVAEFRIVAGNPLHPSLTPHPLPFVFAMYHLPHFLPQAHVRTHTAMSIANLPRTLSCPVMPCRALYFPFRVPEGPVRPRRPLPCAPEHLHQPIPHGLVPPGSGVAVPWSQSRNAVAWSHRPFVTLIRFPAWSCPPDLFFPEREWNDFHPGGPVKHQVLLLLRCRLSTRRQPPHMASRPGPIPKPYHCGRPVSRQQRESPFPEGPWCIGGPFVVFCAFTICQGR